MNDFREASKASEWTYTWASRLIRQAYAREITADELWNLRDYQRAQEAGELLMKEWDREKTRENPAFWHCVVSIFGWEYFKAFLCKMAWLCTVLFTSTYLFIVLLNTINNAETEPHFQLGSFFIPYWGFLYSGLFMVGECCRSLFVHQHWYRTLLVGLRLRTATASMLFRKATRLRRSSQSAGLLLNMFSNDIERLRDGMLYGVFIVSTPITLLAIVGLGIWVIGVGIVGGLAVLVLSVPLQAQLAKRTSALRRETIKVTDKRIGKMNEILKSMLLIKLYGWEDAFTRNLESVRYSEIQKLRKTAYVKALNTALSQVIPIAASLVTFTVHTVGLGNTLTAGQAFSTLALFNVSKFPLAVMPLSVRLLSEMIVAFKRIETFMELEEVSDIALDTPSSFPIEITRAEFAWSVEDTTARNLFIPDLKCDIGSITAIVGPVGSGKSSLLGGAL